MGANNKVDKPADSTTLPELLDMKQGQSWEKPGAPRIKGGRAGEQRTWRQEVKQTLP